MDYIFEEKQFVISIRSIHFKMSAKTFPFTFKWCDKISFGVINEPTTEITNSKTYSEYNGWNSEFSSM